MIHPSRDPVAIERSENLSTAQNKEIHLETSKSGDESDSEEYDTDLEESFEEEKDFHKTQEEIYLKTCRQLNIPPVFSVFKGALYQHS